VPDAEGSRAGNEGERVRHLLLIAMLAAAPLAARAQDAAVPDHGLAFDDAKHRLWYARFWTGKCTGLAFYECRSGEPNWNETTRRLVTAAPAERRAALSARLLKLGRSVGHEWAKENDVRKISTDHIRTWYILLDEAKDAEAAIAQIESEAARALARR
jgi:hypothetical protein